MLTAATVDKLVWVLIYGGIIAFGLGLAIGAGDAALRWLLMAGGGVATALGAVMVVVRSRMKDDGAGR